MADSRASASMGSNNPFRRKTTPTAPIAGVTPPEPTTAPVEPSSESSSSPAAAPVDLPLFQPSTSDFFRQQLQALPQTNTPPPSTTFQKPKVVKKVRVQSPPPSSPESASGVPDRYPVTGYADEESQSSTSSDDEEPEDPFRGTASPLETISHGNYSAPAVAPPAAGRVPPNPFKKTLEDMEQGAKDVPHVPNPSAAGAGKGSLDVDAFKRLLMTGQANVPGAAPPPATSSPQTLYPPGQGQATDAASITDASSVSRQSIFDATIVQETPRTSHEISEPEGEEDRAGLIANPQAKLQHSPSILRKKPPPPSSRHGKLIKVDLSKDKTASPGVDGILRPSSSSSQTAFTSSPGATSPSSRQRPSTPSDINKPLPPAPSRRSIDSTSESIFDREAAGKIPELATPDVEVDPAILGPVLAARPPTPPTTSHATTPSAPATQPPSKPAPPPRRNPHLRTESKAAPKPAPSPVTEDPNAQRRSSQDSTRSRSSSLRVSIHTPAPAPPPPRRPNHASRPSFTSPSSASSFASLTPTSASTATSPAAISESEPPPPPFPPIPAVTSPEPIPPNPNPAAPVPSTVAATRLRGKLSPPPLPPARNASVRNPTGRPGSVSSMDAPSRRVVKDGTAMGPPPPPPPKRGRAGSGRGGGTVEGEEGDEKSANEILADLDKLQREVDALRGRYERKVGGG